jgi:hypothetical protein
MDEQQPLIQPIDSAGQPPREFERPKKRNFWAPVGWLGMGVLIGLLVFVLKKDCDLQPRWLVWALLIDYTALLIVNYVEWFKKARWIFGLLLALMPILAAVATSPWSFWYWALVVILYLFTLLQYFIKSLDDNAWPVIIPVILLLVLLIFKIQRFTCLG